MGVLIAAMAAATALTGSELIIVEQGGVTKKSTTGALNTYLSSVAQDYVATLNGSPTASQVVLSAVSVGVSTLPIGLAGSVVNAFIPAATSTVLTVKVNGVSKGTITFAAGSNYATSSFAAAVVIALADTIEVIAPATPDATLAGIGIFLSAG